MEIMKFGLSLINYIVEYNISMFVSTIGLTTKLAYSVKTDGIGYNVDVSPTNKASLQLAQLLSLGQNLLEALDQAVVVCEVTELICEMAIYLALYWQKMKIENKYIYIKL